MSGALHLLLVGGGHAHLGLLAAARRLPQPLQITLVDAEAHAIYSGMVPGVLAGHHRPDDCMIDLESAARRAGARFVRARAVGLDARARRLHLDDGRTQAYDLLGVDVGSAAPAIGPAAGGAPSAQRLRVLPCRPFRPLLDTLPEIDRRARAEALTIAVVGAGLAGIEVALALAWRTRCWPRVRILLLCASQAPAPALPARARSALAAACARAGVDLVVDARARIEPEGGALLLEDGRRIPADLALLCTGATPPQWLADSGLALDAGGCIAVNTALASLSHPEVYASGDCASVEGHPRPRSGVMAVRQGPLLASSLAHHLEGLPPRGRTPRRHALALVGLGPDRAIALRAGCALGGTAGPGGPEGLIADGLARLLWRWKVAIDRRFVLRHR